MKIIYTIKILFVFVIFSTLSCSESSKEVAKDTDSEVETPEVEAEVISTVVEYKNIAGISLKMSVMNLDNIEAGDKKVALVLMHGGGWRNGNYSSFSNQSNYFASKGLVVFAINYRTTEVVEGNTPRECLQDAKSAMRFIRANAARFSIDPDKIIAGGGSAGGHLAAAVSMCPKINESTDDLSISSDACATILFNPVVCNGPDKVGSYTGYNYYWVKDYYRDFSPMYNVRAGIPPSIFMLGTEDHLIPTSVGDEYRRLVLAVGGRCDLHIYEGQPHSFYHLPTSGNATNFYKTVTASHRFMVSLGYLDCEPTVKEWLKEQDKGYYIE